MTISTRTPEGDPLKCSICGSEHLLLTSWPPGDSVCPSCGAHSWIPKSKPEDVNPTSQIRNQVRTLVDQLRLSSTKVELGIYLVNGMVDCLRAKSAILWISKGHEADRHHPLELIAFNGKPKDCEFAEEIATTREPAMRMVVIQSVESLLIGVPLKTRSGTTAVIEVVQRATSHPDVRTGYLRFVRSMAALVESCSAFR